MSRADALRTGGPGTRPALPWHRPAAVLLILALWGGAAWLADSRELPGPLAVARTLGDHLLAGELLHHLGVTLARVGVSFALAMLIGTAVGLAMGLWRVVDRLGDGLLIVLLNVPALVTIILCYIWFGLTETAAILAVAINKIPNVAVTMREGARALDPAYAAVAQVFRLTPWQRLRHVMLPQLAPYLLASARNGLALIWKIVLVVELIGRSSGVGFQLQLYFQLFEIDSLMAYTAAFVLCVLAIEMSVLKPIERRVNRWRS